MAIWTELEGVPLLRGVPKTIPLGCKGRQLGWWSGEQWGDSTLTLTLAVNQIHETEGLYRCVGLDTQHPARHRLSLPPPES